MNTLQALVFSMLAAAGVAEPSEARSAPIRLIAEPAGNSVRLTVVGNASAPFEGRYTLTATSDVAHGGNRSAQRGTAKLLPNAPVTLITLTLGGTSQGRWAAKLAVEGSDGTSYEQQVGPTSAN